VGPQVQERHAEASPIEAISTTLVFYLFVTLLRETCGNS
jgi:hypothetical protein